MEFNERLRDGSDIRLINTLEDHTVEISRPDGSREFHEFETGPEALHFYSVVMDRLGLGWSSDG